MARRPAEGDEELADAARRPDPLEKRILGLLGTGAMKRAVVAAEAEAR
jgi:hypothetical protein